MKELNLIDGLDQLVVERDKQNNVDKKKREREEKRKKDFKMNALICLSWISNLAIVFCAATFLSFYKLNISTTEDPYDWASNTDIGVFLLVISIMLMLAILINCRIKRLKQ